MWHTATSQFSTVALWAAWIGGLALLVALVCGEGNTATFKGALVGALVCRFAAELGHGYLWHRLQPPGRGRLRRRFATVHVQALSAPLTD